MQCTKRRRKFLMEQVELVLGHPSVLLTIKEFSRITGLTSTTYARPVPVMRSGTTSRTRVRLIESISPS